ncbi:MAG TPA: ATP cone domain-containing protein [Candidatus Saccharimonadia bacterium]|jgi:transcriptional repressor NrdR
MKCPFCRQDTTEVFNSRSTRFGTQIWRRRRCQSCHESFTTYEAPDLGFLKVIKNGHKQRYSRAKLYSGINGAFLSIPHQETTVDAVTDTVEAKLLDIQKRELSTKEIARIVLSTLKHFNTAAFVRYLADSTDLSSDAQLARELKKY